MIKLGSDLSIGLEATAKRIAWLGTIGSGKSYAAMKMAEGLYDAGAQFVALDPVGVWWGLRAPGKGKGIPLTVFGGLHGDVQIREQDGALVADVLCDTGVCAVVDVSQFETESEKARFASDFAGRLFFRKKSAPSAIHLFLEEAQEFIPQDPAKNETVMLSRFNRISKIGRNFGIGVSVITQRPQEVSKKSLNLSEALFAFRMTGVLERKAVADWASQKGIEAGDLKQELPTLERGCPHVWSPEWLKVSRVVAIGQRRTHDASATPEVGAKAVQPQLTKVDVDKVRAMMAEATAKADADDPKKLRARIADLERAAARQSKPVIDQSAVDAAVERAVEQATRDQARVIDQYETLLEKLASEARALAERCEAALKATADAVAKKSPPNGHDPRPEPPVVRPQRRVPAPVGPSVKADVNKPQQSILDVMGDFLALGIDRPSRANVAVFAGQSSKSSTYRNNLGALRSAGLVEYPDGDTVVLTAAGKSAAAVSGSITSLDDLHDAWFAKLPAPQAKILSVLIENRGRSVSREHVAGMTGQSFGSSTFRNNLGALRSLGLASYPDGQTVAVTDLLFPEGLA